MFHFLSIGHPTIHLTTKNMGTTLLIDNGHLSIWKHGLWSAFFKPVNSDYLLLLLRALRRSLRHVTLGNIIFSGLDNFMDGPLGHFSTRTDDVVRAMTEIHRCITTELSLEAFDFSLRRLGCSDDCRLWGGPEPHGTLRCSHYEIGGPRDSPVYSTVDLHDAQMAVWKVPLGEDGWWRRIFVRANAESEQISP